MKITQSVTKEKATKPYGMWLGRYDSNKVVSSTSHYHNRLCLVMPQVKFIVLLEGEPDCDNQVEFAGDYWDNQSYDEVVQRIVPLRSNEVITFRNTFKD